MVDLRRISPGMRVKIVGTPDGIPHRDPTGKMDKWCGQVVTVYSVVGDHITIEEDSGDGPEHQGGPWFWWSGAIDHIVEDVPNYPDFDVASKDEVFSLIFGNC